ncbi:hypothetical protein [Mycoplasma wenyonii]|uniref:hypothetical protein n=1 Tax=Mycoplasma wenyonii TaxID=65123 RepID=UPI000DDAA3B1|nr:hypothetical protein [Mycoplasma wenyonii]
MWRPSNISSPTVLTTLPLPSPKFLVLGRVWGEIVRVSVTLPVRESEEEVWETVKELLLPIAPPSWPVCQSASEVMPPPC